MSVGPKKDGRRKPTQQRSQQTVDALVEATARVLAQEGYDHTTTNRVAAVAGVSVGSLYQYFPNKQALVGAVLEREMVRVTATMQAAIEPNLSAPLPVLVEAVIGAMVRSHRENAPLRRVMMEQVPRLDMLGRFEDHLDELKDVLLAIVAARGDRLRPRDLDLAMYVLVHAIAGATRAAISLQPERLHQEGLVSELSALALRYLMPDEVAPDAVAQAG